MYRKFLPWHIEKESLNLTLKAPKVAQEFQKKIVLLNWNVHKNNHSISWLDDFSYILRRYDPAIILFQEYQKMNKKSILDKHREYGYGFFPNIVWKQNHYGLINAAKTSIVDFDFHTTKEVEPIIKTPKIALETMYPLENERYLKVINVHMINFVKIKKFLSQIFQIEKAISSHEGALILSGDFNTWNKKRMHIVTKMCTHYGLKAVEFAGNYHQKVPFEFPLDHIFYRGLKLQSNEVIKRIETSDHKPMICVFSDE